MDEPLSNLDAKLRVQMRTQVSRIQKTPGHHDALRHPRPDRGHDARRPGRGHARRRRAAGRLAVGPLRPPEQPVRRRLHRQPVDELPARRRCEGGGVVQTALGEAQLQRPSAGRPWSGRRAAERHHGHPPGALRGRALVGDKPGGTFDAPIDIVEAMGSDVYAYFVVKGEGAHSDDLDDLAKDTGNDLHSDGRAGDGPAGRGVARPARAGGPALVRHREGRAVRRRDRAEPGSRRRGRDDVERSPARLS